jgi:hypothetical protein
VATASETRRASAAISIGNVWHYAGAGRERSRVKPTQL